MSFTESIKTVFSKYADFTGRARRSEYWYFTLFNVLVSMILGGLSRSGDSSLNIFTMLSSLYSLAVLIPGLAVCCRRLHDIGRSGWWVLIALIPLVGAIILIVWYCRDSQPGVNDYGPNPKEAVPQWPV